MKVRRTRDGYSFDDGVTFSQIVNAICSDHGVTRKAVGEIEVVYDLSEGAATDLSICGKTAKQFFKNDKMTVKVDGEDSWNRVREVMYFSNYIVVSKVRGLRPVRR